MTQQTPILKKALSVIPLTPQVSSDQMLYEYDLWLKASHYSKSMIYDHSQIVKAFFKRYKIHSSAEILKITDATIQDWIAYVCLRKKHNHQPGTLSIVRIKKHVYAVRQLSRYLRKAGYPSFNVPYQRLGKDQRCSEVLTFSQIQSLYAQADCTQDPLPINEGLLACRDRVILALFYSCGLRRREGIHVRCKDVLLDQGMLFVRCGKNYQQRCLPMTSGSKQDLRIYLQYARPMLLRKQAHPYLLVNWDGRPMDGTQVLKRVKHLASKAGIQMRVGVHLLRHSIATHLLCEGMQIEQISAFLGHQSIESTQGYTHLAASHPGDGSND